MISFIGCVLLLLAYLPMSFGKITTKPRLITFHSFNVVGTGMIGIAMWGVDYSVVVLEAVFFCAALRAVIALAKGKQNT